MSSITQMFNTTISSMRKYFCSKEKFPLSFDGKDDLTYVGHTRYDKEGDNVSFENIKPNISGTVKSLKAISKLADIKETFP